MVKKLSEKEKMYCKSSKLCSICGKIVDNKEEYECSCTRKKQYMVVHKRCI